MARAAVPGRLGTRRAWRAARLAERRPETSAAHTLVLRVQDWPGHQAGQHIDVRLTAEDGYQASRSYSLAAPAKGDHIEITVQRLAGGEVSPYLIDSFSSGDEVEVRGPLGGWFVWHPRDTGPVLLVAGGSGIVPLMAMIRERAAAASRAPFRLICSVQTPEDRIYVSELQRRNAEDGLDVSWVYTRSAPGDESRPTGRLRAQDLPARDVPPSYEPTCYVCGPTGFVESASDLLLAAGHEASRIRTERFGGA